MLSLLSNMKLLMPNNWHADLWGETIRLFSISQSCNPSVERSIIFSNKEKKFSVFVHGAPLSGQSEILQNRRDVDVENIGDLSDFLRSLLSRVDTAAVCSGINSHKEFWDFEKGFLDYSESFESPYFRSKSCSVLMNGKRSNQCLDCRQLLRKLVREQKRSDMEKEDPCSTRDKDLSKAGIKVKKDKYKKIAKQEKKRADRLQQRVESLTIKLDEAMKDELVSLLMANQHKMTDIQRTFWMSQMQAIGMDDKRGIRWDPMLIRIALHLHSLSPNTCEFFENIKILILPSKRRLFDYSHFIEAQEGCQKELLLMIKKKAEKCGPEDHYSYVNVMFDEMHIKSGLVTHRSTGELVGYTNLSGIDEELAKIQQELTMKTYRP